MNSLRKFVLVVSLGLLAACETTAPLSYLSGKPDRPLIDHEYPVRIVAVDQTYYFQGPVSVTPGKHLVTLELRHSSSRLPTQKTLALDVQPCTRYYLTAKKISLMESKWEPRIFDTEQVGGCNAEEELKKASASAGLAVSHS